MTLADFWEIYKADMEKRLRKNYHETERVCDE